MAPGDLNLKKSWNPKLVKNQKKVWEKEQEALEERKRIQERQKEIQEERELQSLRDNRYNTEKKKSTRLEWMYEHGEVGDGLRKPQQESPNEDYLLGKKKLDELIVDKEPKSTGYVGEKMGKVLSKQPVGLSQRDIQKLAKDDPMYKIKLMRAQQRRTKARVGERLKDRKSARG